MCNLLRQTMTCGRSIVHYQSTYEPAASLIITTYASSSERKLMTV